MNSKTAVDTAAAQPSERQALIEFFGDDSDTFAAHSPGYLLHWRARLVGFLQAATTLPASAVGAEDIYRAGWSDALLNAATPAAQPSALEQFRLAVIARGRPEYGKVGTRDVDVAKDIALYDAALAATPVAQPSCGCNWFCSPGNVNPGVCRGLPKAGSGEPTEPSADRRLREFLGDPVKGIGLAGEQPSEAPGDRLDSPITDNVCTECRNVQWCIPKRQCLISRLNKSDEINGAKP